MSNTTQKFLVRGLWSVIIIFFIIRYIIGPESPYDYYSCIGEAISITILLMGIYERWLWWYNPFESIPKIRGSYTGLIEYCYKGTRDEKEATIRINQSLLTTNVKIITDEITSNSIVSNMVNENGEYILYYTYITNPKMKYSNDNPIQYGTCRVVRESETELRGTYWTTSNTMGDVFLKKQLDSL